MKLLAALQKEARKLTKVKADVEHQLNAISAAVKAFGSTLAAESANGRKKTGTCLPPQKHALQRRTAEQRSLALMRSGNINTPVYSKNLVAFGF